MIAPLGLLASLSDLTVGERLSEHPWVYLTMPVVAAIIGYVTKLAAIKMMFEPIEFAGVGRIGWQGIVPKQAARMASITVDKLTSELISVREITDRIDAERLVREIEEPLRAATDRIVRDVLLEYQAGLWESLPGFAQKLVIRQVQAQIPAVVREFSRDAKENIEEIIDLKHLAVTALMRDKTLLNQVFRKVGRKEFAFLARSGLFFGFAIGVVQAGTFLLVPQAWVLPAFGLFVGYSTDWLALKMLFHPREPKKILGIRFHGLFLKRQHEVAGDYGELIAAEVLTPANLYEELLTGPASDRLFDMVLKQVNDVVRRQTSIATPIVVLAVGSRRYLDMKRRVAQRFMEELPAALKAAEEYTVEAMDVRNTLRTRLQALTSTQFEGILRPVFRADESTLIAVGAILGFLVGLSQDLFLVPLFEKL